MAQSPNPVVPLISRHAQGGVLAALLDTPAVLINGPRQSGKTTLTRQSFPDVPYLTLDDATQLAAARADPQGFVRRLDRAIIDEVQRAPELLLALKLSIDQDRRPGRFLLTGSANVMSLPTIADSLAGRIEIHTLLPLSSAEIAGRPAQFLARAAMQDWSGTRNRGPVGDAFIEQMLAGGYPEMRLRATPARRQAWARAYITTLVERDIQDVARIEEAGRIPELLAILSALTGQLLNLSQLGGQLGLNLRTAEKYVAILEKLFLIRRLPAWTRNELGRLIKTPKLHFIDAGLQGAIARTTGDLLIRDRQRLGPLLESWVFGELLKAIHLDNDAWFISHYRDKDQVEVDFVLESPQRTVIGIEVKAAASVNAADFKGLRRLRDQCGRAFISGIVLYDGEAVLPFGEGLWAVPLGCM